MLLSSSQTSPNTLKGDYCIPKKFYWFKWNEEIWIANSNRISMMWIWLSVHLTVLWSNIYMLLWLTSMLLLTTGYISFSCLSGVKQVARPYRNKSVCVSVWYKVSSPPALKHPLKLQAPAGTISWYKMSRLTGAVLLSNGCSWRFHAFWHGPKTISSLEKEMLYQRNEKGTEQS